MLKMPFAEIFDHWELLAGVFTVLLLLVASLEVPHLVLQPGLALAAILPADYNSFLLKTQIRSGWRHDDAFAQLMALKLYPALITSFALFSLVGAWQALAGLSVFFLPETIVFLLMKVRQKKIVASLPSMLDLMVLCVEAGLGIDATIKRIAERGAVSNPLYLEMRLLSNDILFGMSHERAHDELFLRTGLAELKSVSSALNQCTKRGLSIAKILKAQSDFWRNSLARQAEKRANKLPVLMAFPIWLLIMPAVLIVLVSPAILRHMDILGTMVHH
jgi:tight adherence protein C